MTSFYLYLWLFIYFPLYHFTRGLQFDLLKYCTEIHARPWFQAVRLSSLPSSMQDFILLYSEGAELLAVHRLSQVSESCSLRFVSSVHLGPGKVCIAFNPNYIFSFLKFYVLAAGLVHRRTRSWEFESNQITTLITFSSKRVWTVPPSLPPPSLPLYSLFFFNSYYVPVYWYFTHNLFITILQVRILKLGSGDLSKTFQIVSDNGDSKTTHSLHHWTALPLTLFLTWWETSLGGEWDTFYLHSFSPSSL